MNSLFKQFLDKLGERIFSLIGSSIGTAASTYHAVNQTEQQSLLEDLARRYESEGKDDLADYLRRHASSIANGDPARDGQNILHQVLGTQDNSTRLLGGPAQEVEPELPPTRTRRKRRTPQPPADPGQVSE